MKIEEENEMVVCADAFIDLVICNLLAFQELYMIIIIAELC
jgi:hypothetical protein